MCKFGCSDDAAPTKPPDCAEANRHNGCLSRRVRPRPYKLCEIELNALIIFFGHSGDSKPTYGAEVIAPRSATLHVGLLRYGLFEAKMATVFIRAFNGRLFTRLT